MAVDVTAIATALLLREASLLDAQDWHGWLDLYTEDAVYWVPAWRSEHQQTSDPDREISQIYHDSRHGLAERVARIESGKSVIARPLPRTTHFVSNVVAQEQGADVIDVESAWMTRVYDPRTEKQYANFGRVETRLRCLSGDWRIARKKITLQNDLIPALLEFYTL